MDNKYLEELIIKYEQATNSEITDNIIKLGDEASWTAKKALKSLEYEPEGNLAILLLYKAWEEAKRGTLPLSEFLANPDYVTRIFDFDNEMLHGKPSTILEETMNNANSICNKFDVDVIESLNENRSKFIDIFAEAYQNIYKEYEVDRFACKETKNNEPYIGLHEYHFHHLKEFVDCLRRSDNCIIYAKIDGIHDYDNADEYDTFFAFGCRCEDKVYINSNREYHATLKSREIKKTRNPSKALRNKASNTWMPYYDLQENGTQIQVDNALMVIDPNIVPPIKINEQYDGEAKLIICLSIALMYQKYFKQKVRKELRWNHALHKHCEVEDNYFGEEIKLLPKAEMKSDCTEIALYNELQLPILKREELEIVHPTLYHNDVTFFDYYIKRYVKEDELREPINIDGFIGDKEAAKQRAWWEYRNAAKPLINERRTKEICDAFRIYDKDTKQIIDMECVLNSKSYWGNDTGYVTWSNISEYNDHVLKHRQLNLFLAKDFDLHTVIKNNLSNIFKICLKQDVEDPKYMKAKVSEKDKYFSVGIDKSGRNIYDFLDDYSFDLHTLKVELDTEWSSLKQYKRFIRNATKYWSYNSYLTDFNSTLYYSLIDGDCVIIPNDGGENKCYEFNLTCRNVFDLCHLLGIKREMLPPVMQRWMCSRYSSNKPYTGNHILDITDPLDQIYDMVDEKFEFKITVYMSKSNLNKFSKLLDTDIEIRDRSRDEEIYGRDY